MHFEVRAKRERERETFDTTLYFRVDSRFMEGAGKIELEAKINKLARVSERIPSLEAGMAERECQTLTVSAKAQAILA